jgi:hypothetical protein
MGVGAGWIRGVLVVVSGVIGERKPYPYGKGWWILRRLDGLERGQGFLFVLFGINMAPETPVPTGTGVDTKTLGWVGTRTGVSLRAFRD